MKQIDLLNDLKITHPELKRACKKLGIVPKHKTIATTGVSKKIVRRSVVWYSREQVDALRRHLDKDVAMSERFRVVHNLHKYGVSEPEIARVAKLNSEIVTKFLSCKTFAEYEDRYVPKPTPKPTEEIKAVETQTVAPMADMIQLQLLKEIKEYLRKLVLLEERYEGERRLEKQKPKKVVFPFLGN